MESGEPGNGVGDRDFTDALNNFTPTNVNSNAYENDIREYEGAINGGGGNSFTGGIASSLFNSVFRQNQDARGYDENDEEDDNDDGEEEEEDDDDDDDDDDDAVDFEDGDEEGSGSSDGVGELDEYGGEDEN